MSTQQAEFSKLSTEQEPTANLLSPLSLEEKQIILLNRCYTNIEGWKEYRFRIPTTICLSMIGLTTFLGQNQRISWVLAISIGFIAVAGCFAQSYVRKHYLFLASQIYHLYDKLNMNGPDFYPEGKDYTNQQQKVKEIFVLGYVSIAFAAIICELLIFCQTQQ